VRSRPAGLREPARPDRRRVGSSWSPGRSVFSQHTNAVREKLFIPIHHDACGYMAKKDLDVEVAKLPAENSSQGFRSSTTGRLPATPRL